LTREEQKSHWDLKYEQGLPSLAEPDPFFLFAYERFVEPLFPNAGTALDLACGLGRHALWLAIRNWRVRGVDLSGVAIENLKRAALERNVDVDLFVGDASDYEFVPMRFDLIVLFYHLDRRLFPKIASALKPGGFLICKMSLRWDVVGLTADVLNRNELPSLVPELQALHHQERPVRERGVVEFVGKLVGE
jgi:SAM-dependent methyltransferase